MPRYDDLPYRTCVGMMLINKDGLVFIGRRAAGIEHVDDTHVWQMPQGGVDEGEDLCAAAQRELWEETGVDRSRSSTRSRLADLRVSAHHGRTRSPRQIRGQRQKWFALRFTGRRTRSIR